MNQQPSGDCSPARRQQCLQTARDIVRRDGLDELTPQRLARELNLEAGAIESLIGSQRDLVRALYQSWVEEWQHRLMASAPELPSDALLRQAARLYRELACSDRALFLASTSSTAIEADLFGLMARSPAFQLFADMVKQGMAERRFRVSADPDATVRTLWAGVHGAIMLEVCGKIDERSGRQSLDEMVTLLIRGLQTHPGN